MDITKPFTVEAWFHKGKSFGEVIQHDGIGASYIDLPETSDKNWNEIVLTTRLDKSGVKCQSCDNRLDLALIDISGRAKVWCEECGKSMESMTPMSFGFDTTELIDGEHTLKHYLTKFYVKERK